MSHCKWPSWLAAFAVQHVISQQSCRRTAAADPQAAAAATQASLRGMYWWRHCPRPTHPLPHSTSNVLNFKPGAAAAKPQAAAQARHHTHPPSHALLRRLPSFLPCSILDVNEAPPALTYLAAGMCLATGLAISATLSLGLGDR